MRGSCNPDPDSWVAEFISWWIDQETGFPIDERAGVLRWFVRVGGEIKWAATREDACLLDADPKRARPKSVTFIPATIYDNPLLLTADPDYLGNLLAQDVVTQGRLLAGNWKIRPAAGVLFQRGWYEIVEAVPAGGICCRFWDFAATARKISRLHDDSEEVGRKTPDFTSSCFASFRSGRMYIIDSTEELLGPAEADAQVINYAKQDRMWAQRNGCSNYMVRWEEEGGASGKRDSSHLYALLHGFDCEAVRPQGDKITRAKPLARQSKAGNVKLLSGEWVEKWLTHMHNQPVWPHDDRMDSSAGCYNALTDDGPFVPSSAGTVAIVDAAEIMRQLQQNGRNDMFERLRNG
jgi:predicted phage terminase large subunit-like protein